MVKEEREKPVRERDEAACKTYWIVMYVAGILIWLVMGTANAVDIYFNSVKFSEPISKLSVLFFTLSILFVIFNGKLLYNQLYPIKE